MPPEVDTTKANVARVYDYWVGGDHNFQADRDLARTITARDPNIRATMRANRAFLGRVVRFLAGQASIRQASIRQPPGRQAAAPQSLSGATTRCRGGSWPSEYVSTSNRAFRCSCTTLRSWAPIASSATGRRSRTAVSAA